MIDPAVQVALVAAVATVGAAAIAAIPGLLQRRQLREVKEQVANNHSTNLRDDVDRVIDGLNNATAALAQVLENQRRHDAEIAGVRQDLRIEREERLTLARRIP
ncbi:DUF2746 domain-containing protein [Plantactinospora sp. WMMB782]|uniref:DUF2746 domain-containing protein n=1 Tax=Plantactinospora sp. WMMB782 TaxID=3404121 RepID=UPI003B92B502